MRCGNCGNELRGEARFCSKCGAPVPPSSSPYAPYGQQSSSTFGDAPRAQFSGAPPRKSGCGKALLILSVIGLLVVVALGVGGYFVYRFAEDKLKSSEAYTLAVDALKSDPEVAERMGAIKETGFPLGNFKEDADGTGSAVFRVSVTGEKASGNYDVVMSRSERRWTLRSGKVTLNNGGGEITVAPDEDDLPALPDLDAPPPVPAKPGATGPKPVAGGVLNGKAVSKPDPPYPAVARAARASGTVVVQVELDEAGRVTSARAVSGHPLLRAAAEAAARQARFKPTVLSGKPVRVTGTLTYNFEPPAEQR
jgi:TonB family protein